MPGAIPQSITAVIFLYLARLSSSRAFSGINEISTTFLPASIIFFNTEKPMLPGKAPTTKSAFAIFCCKSLRLVTSD